MLKLRKLRKSGISLLDNNGYEKEIIGTERLLEIIRYNPEIMDAYDENLFIHTVDNVLIGNNGSITFRLINNLELTEYADKGGDNT